MKKRKHFLILIGLGLVAFTLVFYYLFNPREIQEDRREILEEMYEVDLEE